MAGLIFALLLACSSEREETKSVQSEGPAVSITADQLFNAYKANEVAADEKFKDKVLLVSGTIDNIGKDITDTPYVVLKAGGDFSFGGVQCMFDDKAKGQLANLQKGQKVQIKGKCNGKMGNVLLRGSVLQ